MASGQGSEPKSKKNKCEICGRIFLDADALGYHKKVEHDPDKRPPTRVT